MRKKIIILLSIVAVAIVVVFAGSKALPTIKSKLGDIKESLPLDELATNSTSVSDNTVQLEAPTDATTETSQQGTTQTKPKEGYVKFEYDPNESNDSYLSSKTSIQGSGTVNLGDSSDVSIQSGTTTKGGDNTQQFWYEEAEKKGKDYIYAITDYEFSNGFGFVPSQKYDIRPEAILGSSVKVDAPNDTSIILRELDSTKGDATYWREYSLEYNSFGKWESLTEVDTLKYNTPYILGTGLENWDKLNIYNEQDLTLNPYGTQLICDISVDTLFGEGYYFETVDVDTGVFTGVMIIQHGDRVYYCEAESEYHDSLKDICTAIVDRCITTY